MAVLPDGLGKVIVIVWLAPGEISSGRAGHGNSRGRSLAPLEGL